MLGFQQQEANRAHSKQKPEETDLLDVKIREYPTE